ncbi:MAG: alpha/beta hydrolase, partial [Cyclobacteriaceae bacterium]|nr:alpha/beta hydrolase [Cyclobacteriaceae bacterium]
MKVILKIRFIVFLVVGDFSSPASPKALVLMIHGSGAGRYSTWNRKVADYLNEQGVATFLCDLTDAVERES